MKRVRSIAWTMATAAAAATPLGFVLLRPVLHPTTDGMTDKRIEAERWLLLDAARELPWWLGWAPAMRHDAVSGEWLARHAALDRSEFECEGLAKGTVSVLQYERSPTNSPIADDRVQRTTPTSANQ